MSNVKKILTLDNLVNFCKNEKFYSFNAKDTGYQLAVQVPSKFEISSDYEDNTLLFCNVRLFHIGENRNKSSVTKEAATKSLSTIAYKPLLANFCEIDGVKDFTAHDMEIDEDGNVVYLEKQIGCFTADSPEIRYDEEEEKEFVFARVAIPREYTDACDIIERKNGTKVSVELLINEMSYSVEKQVLELNDIIVSGATCLGKNPETGEDVNEGMKGARLDIEDFSNKNNSIVDVFTDKSQDKLIEVLNKLNIVLSNLNNVESVKKGGDTEMSERFKEILEEFEIEESEVDFEYDSMTEEEFTAALEEYACKKKKKCSEDEEDNEPEVHEEEYEEFEEEDDEPEATENEACKKKKKCEEEGNGEPEEEEPVATEDEACKKKKKCSLDDKGNMTVSFEISHEDIRSALFSLLGTYEEQDAEWYWITNVYDDYFVYENWSGEKIYKQSYTVDGDNVAFSGDRQEVFKMILTESEKLAIEKMREDYSALEIKYNELKEFKEQYDAAEIKAEKDAIFASAEYVEIRESEEFQALIADADKYSVDEIKVKADLIFAASMKKKFNFKVEKPEIKNSVSININEKPKEQQAYAGLFDE